MATDHYIPLYKNGTEINDNNDLLDDYILPFSGNINWPALMKALRKIWYDGNLGGVLYGGRQEERNRIAGKEIVVKKSLKGIGKNAFGACSMQTMRFFLIPFLAYWGSNVKKQYFVLR